VGGRYLPHTSSSSGGLVRRRSTESRESLASHASQSGQVSTLRHSHSHKTLSRRGSRHRSREDNRGSSSRPRSPPLPLNPATPLYSKKDLGLSEPGKTPTQDASDSEDYLRNKLLRSASEEGLNIPSTPEFSFDGNLSNSPYPVLNRRGSRIVSPASESSSYQGSIPGSGRSEQDSYTTQSERSFTDNRDNRTAGDRQKTDPRKYFTDGGGPGPSGGRVQGRNTARDDLEEALLRTGLSGYFLPEYKH